METLKLDVTVDDAQDMLDYYKTKLDEFIRNHPDIIKKYNELLDKTMRINKLLDQNNNTVFKISRAIDNNANTYLIPPIAEVYPLHGTWNARIKYCLNEEPKGLTSRQIMDMIAAKEGIGNSENDEFKRIRIGVSANLSTSSGEDGIYRRHKNKNGDYVYRLKEKTVSLAP